MTAAGWLGTGFPAARSCSVAQSVLDRPDDRRTASGLDQALGVARLFCGDIACLALAQLPVRSYPARSAHLAAAQCFVDSVMDSVRLCSLYGKESPYVHRVAVTVRARMMRRERAWWLMIQVSAQRDSDRRTRSSRIACLGHDKVGVVREGLPHTASVPLLSILVTQLFSLSAFSSLRLSLRDRHTGNRNPPVDRAACVFPNRLKTAIGP